MKKISSKKILLIANKGNLCKSIYSKLNKYFETELLFVVKENILDTKKYFYENNKIHNYDIVLYISGETKNKKFMRSLNFELPFEFANYCQNKSKSFIYLSSLSVFGLPKKTFSKSFLCFRAKCRRSKNSSLLSASAVCGWVYCSGNNQRTIASAE